MPQIGRLVLSGFVFCFLYGGTADKDELVKLNIRAPQLVVNRFWLDLPPDGYLNFTIKRPDSNCISFEYPKYAVKFAVSDDGCDMMIQWAPKYIILKVGDKDEKVFETVYDINFSIILNNLTVIYQNETEVQFYITSGCTLRPIVGEYGEKKIMFILRPQPTSFDPICTDIWLIFAPGTSITHDPNSTAAPSEPKFVQFNMYLVVIFCAVVGVFAFILVLLCMLVCCEPTAIVTTISTGGGSIGKIRTPLISSESKSSDR